MDASKPAADPATPAPRSSKLTTTCVQLAQNSYKCIERNPQSAQETCQPEFAAYKACRKAEHDAIVDERRRRGATIG